MNYQTIAVDFDGTIVQFKYPDIGPEVPYAIETLHILQHLNIDLYLWTCRNYMGSNE